MSPATPNLAPLAQQSFEAPALPAKKLKATGGRRIDPVKNKHKRKLARQARRRNR